MVESNPQIEAAEIVQILPPHLRRPRLRRWEASEYLRLAHGIDVAPATLARYAVSGRGPEFERFDHRPLYTPAALDAWVAERIQGPRRSTSEVPR